MLYTDCSQVIDRHAQVCGVHSERCDYLFNFCHCVSVTQKSKGATEKKTKRKSDGLDEEIASDSDEEYVEFTAGGPPKLFFKLILYFGIGLLRARLKRRGGLVIILIQKRKKRQLPRKD